MTEILPNVTEDMLRATFWVSDSDYAKDQSGLRSEYQQYILNHTDSMRYLLDLWTRSQQSNVELPTPALPTSPFPTLYDNQGERLPEAFFAELSDRINTANPVVPRLQPGFAVRRADLRRYPTNVAAFRQPSDREFDRFQDTALHTFEPVLIVLETQGGEWNYVLSTTYVGWVQKQDIARATPNQFEKWATFTRDIGRAFMIPLGNAVYTQAAPYQPKVAKVNLEFAAYLPVCEDNKTLGNQSPAGNLCVCLPVRDDNGWLDVEHAFVSVSAPHQLGFRPYSRKSVVESAFALLSERYGWGDSFGNHDCSSLIMDSYRTIGIQFPRDADKQEESLPNFVSINAELSFSERTELLKTLQPGDPLYMPGHTMMYLGYRDGHHYVIHDFAGYTEDVNPLKPNDTVPKGNDSTTQGTTGQSEAASNTRSVPINEVMVSTLDIKTSRDKTYLEELTGAARLFE